MNTEEYQIMFEVEDRHWWYRSLRALLALYWRRHVVRLCGDRGDVRVLDAGCGTGAGLCWLRARARPVGIDLSPLAIQFCRRRGELCCGLGSTLALPFADDTFDVLTSFDVLGQDSIPDKKTAIKELHRVLKPGGLLFLNLPAYQWLHSSHDVAVHNDHRFTRREAVGLLAACGYEILDATYWNTLLFPGILVTRLWRKWMRPTDSDLTLGAQTASSSILVMVLSVERVMLRLTPLPFGLSAFVVARKPQ